MFPAEVGGLGSVLFSDELLVDSCFSPSAFFIYEKSILIGLKTNIHQQFIINPSKISNILLPSHNILMFKQLLR